MPNHEDATFVHGAGGPPPAATADLTNAEEAFVARAPAPIAFPFARVATAPNAADRLKFQVSACANLIRYVVILSLAAVEEQGDTVESELELLAQPEMTRWVEAYGRLAELLKQKMQPDRALAKALVGIHQQLEVEQRMRMREIVNMRAVETEVGQLTNLARFQDGLPAGEVSDKANRRNAEFHRKAFQTVIDTLGDLLRFRLVYITDPAEGAEPQLLELVGAREGFNPVDRRLPGGVQSGRVYVERPGQTPLDVHPLAIFHECYERYKADPEGDAREVFFYRGHSGRRIYFQGTRHQLATQELAAVFHDRFGRARGKTGLPTAAGARIEALRIRWTGELAGAGLFTPERFVSRKAPIQRLRSHLAQQKHPLLLLSGRAGDGKTALLGHLAATLTAEGHWVLPLDYSARRPVEAGAAFEELLDRTLREVLLEASQTLMDDKRLVILVDHLDRHLQRDLLDTLIRLATGWDREFPFLSWIVALRSDFLEAISRDELGARSLAVDGIAQTAVDGLDGVVQRPWYRLPLLDDEERDRLYESTIARAEHRALSPLHLVKRSTLEMCRHPATLLLTTAAYRNREIRSTAELPDVLNRYCRKVIDTSEPRRDLVRDLVRVLIERKRESLSVDALIDAGSEALTQELLGPNTALEGLISDRVIHRGVGDGGPFAEKQLSLTHALVLAHLVADQLERRELSTSELAALLDGPVGGGLNYEALAQLITRDIAAGELRRPRRLIQLTGAALRPVLHRLLASEEARVGVRARSDGNQIGPLAARFADLEQGGAALFEIASQLYLEGPSRLPRVRVLLERLLETPISDQRPIDYYLARVQLATGDPKTALKTLKRAEKRMKNPTPEWDYKLSSAIAEGLIETGQAPKAEAAAKKLFDRLQVAEAREWVLPCRLLLARAVAAGERHDEATGLFERALESAMQENHPRWLRRIRKQFADYLASQDNIALACEHYRRLATDAQTRGAPLEQVDYMLRIDTLGADQSGASERMSRLASAVAAVEPLGPSMTLARALSALGRAQVDTDRVGEALDCYRQAIALAQQFADEPFLAEAYARLGEALQSRGDFQSALDKYSKSLELRKRLGDRTGLGRTYHHIALIFREMGDGAKALEYFAKNVELATRRKDVLGAARSRVQMAVLHAASGDDAQASQALREARAAFEQASDAQGRADALLAEGLIEQERGDLPKAGECFEAAVLLQSELNDRKGLAACYTQLALIHKSRGKEQQALDLFEQAAEIHEARGDRRSLAAAHNNIGVIYDARGEHEKALASFEKDLSITEELRDFHGMATSYGNLAILHYNQRNYVKALYCLEKQRDLHQRLGDPEIAAEVEAKIAKVKSKM